MDSMICECGHSKYEHNEGDNETYYLYESCNCTKYLPIKVKIIKVPDKTIIINKKVREEEVK